MKQVNDSNVDLQAELALQLATRSGAVIGVEFTFLFLVCLTSVCGNFLIILAIAKTSSLRTTSNYYIASLSLQNLLLSVSFIAFVPAVAIQGRWTSGAAACQFFGFVTAMLATGSIYSMAFIAINRYFIMLKSSLHRKYFTKRNVAVSIVISWILSCNFPLSYSLQQNRFDFHPGKGICIFDVSKLTAIDAAFAGVFNIQLPYIVTSVCYFLIYRKVTKHQARLQKPLESGVARNTHISAHDIRITKVLFSIVLAFTFCWIPFFVIDLLGVVYGQYFAPRSVYLFYSIMSGSSTSVSPILYGVLNRDVKKEITNFLKTFLCLFKRRTVRVHAVATPAIK